MLDLKGFLQLFKKLKVEKFLSNSIVQSKDVSGSALDKFEWQFVDQKTLGYSVYAIDGSMVEPNRHFGNDRLGFVCASLIFINYQNSFFKHSNWSKIIELTDENLPGATVSDKLAQAMVDFELEVAQNNCGKGFEVLFLDMSFGYLLKNRSLIDFAAQLPICNNSAVVFYTAKPCPKVFGKIGNVEQSKLNKNAWLEFDKKEGFDKNGEKFFHKSCLINVFFQGKNEFALADVLTRDDQSNFVSIIFDQIKKGSGYPRALALAHNFCTVSSKEGLFFNQLIGQQINFGQMYSNKQMQKNSLYK